MPTRPAWTLLIAALVTACAARPAGDAETQASSSNETGASTESGGTDESTESGETGVVDPCGCDEGQLCVATCEEPGPSIPAGHRTLEDLRCIDDTACTDQPPDNPVCINAACGSPYYFLLDACDTPEEVPGIDLVCSDYETESDCMIEIQDCPMEEKCLWLPPLLEGVEQSVCVMSEGSAEPGESCSTDGAPDYTDSCDASSMCWTGALSHAPGEGTCLAFCTPGCPGGSACEVLDPEGFVSLCVPDP